MKPDPIRPNRRRQPVLQPAAPKAEFPAASYFQVHFDYLYEQLEALRQWTPPSESRDAPSSAYFHAHIQLLHLRIAELRQDLGLLKMLLQQQAASCGSERRLSP